jgi:hypothetical protein
MNIKRNLGGGGNVNKAQGLAKHHADVCSRHRPKNNPKRKKHLSNF